MSFKTFEQVIEVKRVEDDVYDVAHCPVWSWPGTSVFPAVTLMAQAISAAYETIGPDFAIDSLSTYFVAGPDPKLPLRCRVERLSDGGRFVTRTVSLEQNEKRKVYVTCGFVRYGALGGPSMTHCMPRQSHQPIEKITLDDLEPAKNSLGPYMKSSAFHSCLSPPRQPHRARAPLTQWST